jgi:hypothetical protein
MEKKEFVARSRWIKSLTEAVNPAVDMCLLSFRQGTMITIRIPNSRMAFSPGYAPLDDIICRASTQLYQYAKGGMTIVGRWKDNNTDVHNPLCPAWDGCSTGSPG